MSLPDFESMWRDLAPIGRSAATGGYLRQPWTPAERELRAWFREEAVRRELAVEEDRFGNLVAWWGAGSRDRRQSAFLDHRSASSVEEVAQQPSRDHRDGAVLTGSHLDSVVDGGAYDGPLGVVSAFAAIDRMRAAGVVPTRPVGVAAFAEEEGSRFGRACLGSRLAAGTADWADVHDLRDADGVALADVVEGGTRDPWLEDVACFVELHVEQGRGLVDLDEPVGVASGIWPHGRWRFDFTGRADHAGSTRMADRADPMTGYARTVLAAREEARRVEQRATFGRLAVHPNGTNAIPSRVTAWLDARADSTEALDDLVGAIEREGAAATAVDGTALAVTAESVSPAVAFAADLRREVGGAWPVLASQAGHDAGILQAAGIDTAMLFVRNPTGVSHAPDEFAATADCLAGVDALADALTWLVA